MNVQKYFNVTTRHIVCFDDKMSDHDVKAILLEDNSDGDVISVEVATEDKRKCPCCDEMRPLSEFAPDLIVEQDGTILEKKADADQHV